MEELAVRTEEVESAGTEEGLVGSSAARTEEVESAGTEEGLVGSSAARTVA